MGVSSPEDSVSMIAISAMTMPQLATKACAGWRRSSPREYKVNGSSTERKRGQEPSGEPGPRRPQSPVQFRRGASTTGPAFRRLKHSRPRIST